MSSLVGLECSAGSEGLPAVPVKGWSLTHGRDIPAGVTAHPLHLHHRPKAGGMAAVTDGYQNPIRIGDRLFLQVWKPEA